MTTILLVIVALALLPAALKILAAVLPGLLKGATTILVAALVIGGVAGLLYLLAPAFVNVVPDWVWAGMVLVVFLGFIGLLIVATVWDAIKRFTARRP
jgi:hypothetical protein